MHELLGSDIISMEPNLITITPKENRPKKVCIVCNREFMWKKKWAKTWQYVRYCSEKCKRAARQQ